MITAADLHFNEIRGNAPVLSCHNCGKKEKGVGWLAADIKINDSHDTITWTVCSRECEEKFKAHPNVQDYIEDGLFRVMMHVELGKRRN